MLRFVGALAMLAAAVPLAGCNDGGGAMASPAAAVPMAPTAYRLPAGAPCSNEISQYHAVVQSDLQTGNVEQKVYDQINAELNRAAAACDAGKGGEAHSIVAASKARHGYRA